MIASLGVVSVVTPGNPVRATVNRPDPALRIAAQSVRFQAKPDNGGVVYIKTVDTVSSPVAGPDSFTLAVLAKPVSATTGPFDAYTASVPNVPGSLNPADFYIDAADPNDGVIVSYTAQ